MEAFELLEEMLTRMIQLESTKKLRNKAKTMLSQFHQGRRSLSSMKGNI